MTERVPVVLDERISKIETDVASLGAEVHGLAAAVNRLVDSTRPQWGVLIAAATTVVTVLALALSPIAWLAIQNNSELTSNRDRRLDVYQQIGVVQNEVERNKLWLEYIERQAETRATQITANAIALSEMRGWHKSP